jgi:hypothetical protein
MHMYLCNVDEYLTVPYSEILPIRKAYKILIFRSIFFFEIIELSWQISSISYGLIDKMTERGQQKPNSKIWTVLFFIQF